MCTIPTPLHRTGVDLRTAQQLLGHATIQMTAEIYTHLEAEDSLKAVHRIDEYLQKTTG
ncbi:tyrosine-type recombinase/integrase [Gemmiger sp.]|uniref:tyrosine-type recombinase/integrase n=1 Tax=Gemmiger sp. TaxID=2049027 RepID=UPI003FA5C496